MRVFDNKGTLPREVSVRGVDDGEFTCFERCILQVNAE